jgi:uncharacterized membrane protein
MKKIAEFIKTTALGGLVLIVPIAVMGVAIGYLINLLISANKAISELLPYDIFGHPAVAVAAAVCTVILICFAAGLLLRTGLGAHLASWLDNLLTEYIPMFGMIKSLTRKFTGKEALAFTPAEVDLYGSDARMIAFVIEELPDDRYAVFVPSAPALTVGNVFVLPATSVTLLDKSAKVAIDAVTQWGSGASLLYTDDAGESTTADAAEQTPSAS